MSGRCKLGIYDSILFQVIIYSLYKKLIIQLCSIQNREVQ